MTDSNFSMQSKKETESSFESIVIDVRSESEFKQGHLRNSCHFRGIHSDDGLLSRLSELPEPQLRTQLSAIAVANDEQTAETAVKSLLEAGFRNVRVESISPYDTTILVSNKSRRLWAPSSLAKYVAQLDTPTTVLDVGCGGGRDTAWLAARGWRVHAVDRCEKLLKRAALLSTRLYEDDADVRGVVNTEVRTFGADNTQDKSWLRANAAKLVLVVRFLRRPLLQMLGCAVLPGGLLAYEHFLDGCEEFGAPKKKSQMLRHGELASLYAPHSGFDIIRNEVTKLPDGRPVNRFVARKRS